MDESCDERICLPSPSSPSPRPPSSALVASFPEAIAPEDAADSGAATVVGEDSGDESEGASVKAVDDDEEVDSKNPLA